MSVSPGQNEEKSSYFDDEIPNLRYTLSRLLESGSIDNVHMQEWENFFRAELSPFSQSNEIVRIRDLPKQRPQAPLPPPTPTNKELTDFIDKGLLKESKTVKVPCNRVCILR